MGVDYSIKEDEIIERTKKRKKREQETGRIIKIKEKVEDAKKKENFKNAENKEKDKIGSEEMTKEEIKYEKEKSLEKLIKNESQENIKINSSIQSNEINNINNENINKSGIISEENNNFQIKNEIKESVHFFDNISIQKNDNTIKIINKNNLHDITGHKISLDENPIAQKENNTMKKNINDNNSQIQIKIKFPYEKDIPQKILNVKGNFTVDELEKKFIDEKFVFDRGMSIRDIKKPLIELLKNQSTLISFSLMKKSDKLIKDLEECEINCKNIAYASCYQSSTLQGFVHIILPISIKNINRLREKKGLRKIENLDELKNDSIFNNTLIDSIKGLLDIQKCGSGGIDKNGNINFEAHLLFKISPPLLAGGGQGINNIGDIELNHEKIITESKDRENAINAGNKLACFIENLDKESENDNLKNKRTFLEVHNPPKKSLINKSFAEKDLVKSIEIKKNNSI